MFFSTNRHIYSVINIDLRKHYTPIGFIKRLTETKNNKTFVTTTGRQYIVPYMECIIVRRLGQIHRTGGHRNAQTDIDNKRGVLKKRKEELAPGYSCLLYTSRCV